MKAKTELLLYRLEWLAGKTFSRGFFDLTESFECWAYHNGLLNQIHKLEARGFLEARHDPASGKRLHRLTEAGRMAILNRRDPETAWATPWDRKWRLFIFDIPEHEKSKRRQLTRVLAKAGCGCLQGIFWISPATPPEIEKLIAKDDPDCTHLMMLLADSKGPKVDAKMIAGAWDFDAINAAYRDLQDLLDRFPQLDKNPSAEDLDAWTSAEY